MSHCTKNFNVEFLPSKYVAESRVSQHSAVNWDIPVWA